MQSSGPVAQGIEHRIPNPGVAGSNPAGITKLNFCKEKDEQPAPDVICETKTSRALKNTVQNTSLSEPRPTHRL